MDGPQSNLKLSLFSFHPKNRFNFNINYLIFKRYSKENIQHTKINRRLHKFLLDNQVCTEIQRLNENKNDHSLTFRIEAQ